MLSRLIPNQYAKFAANSLWLIFEQVSTALLAVLVAALVARYLGPVDFGKVAYAYSMAAMFAIIGQLGLDGLVVRELKSAPDKAGITLGTVMAMKLAAFGLAAVLLIAFVFLVPGHDEVDQGLFVFAAVFVVLSSMNTLTAWFHSRVEGRVISLTHLAGTLSGSGLKVALVFLGAGVVWFAAANVLAVTVSVALMLLAFNRSGGPPMTQWRFSSEKARQLMSEGGLVLIGSIFAIIYLKIDLAMLRWMTDQKVVGEYAVASQLSEAAYIIPAAIVASVFPRLVELKDSNPSSYEWRFQQLLDTLLLASLGVLVGVYLFGGLLLDVLFGESYAGSTPILLIHILAAPFIYMRYAFSRWILIERVAVFSILTQGAGVILNVALNLVLIPHMAGQGAAIATVISYAAASYLSLAIWDRTRPVFFKMSRSLFTPWAALGRVLSKSAIVPRATSS